jgi:hypothetical protein
VGHHGQGLLHKGLEALADGLRVVVAAAAGLAALEQARLHDLLWAVEEQHALRGLDHGLKHVRLVQRPGEGGVG